MRRESITSRPGSGLERPETSRSVGEATSRVFDDCGRGPPKICVPTIVPRRRFRGEAAQTTSEIHTVPPKSASEALLSRHGDPAGEASSAARRPHHAVHDAPGGSGLWRYLPPRQLGARCLVRLSRHKRDLEATNGRGSHWFSSKRLPQHGPEVASSVPCCCGARGRKTRVLFIVQGPLPCPTPNSSLLCPSEGEARDPLRRQIV